MHANPKQPQCAAACFRAPLCSMTCTTGRVNRAVMVVLEHLCLSNNLTGSNIGSSRQRNGPSLLWLTWEAALRFGLEQHLAQRAQLEVGNWVSCCSSIALKLIKTSIHKVLFRFIAPKTVKFRYQKQKMSQMSCSYCRESPLLSILILWQ